MSALASILAAVRAELAALTGQEDRQNERLSALEARVSALEDQVATPPPSAAARPGARKTAAAAGVASSTAKAKDPA
jgi:cell division septum initiation protein DivIVA